MNGSISTHEILICIECIFGCLEYLSAITRLKKRHPKLDHSKNIRRVSSHIVVNRMEVCERLGWASSDAQDVAELLSKFKEYITIL